MDKNFSFVAVIRSVGIYLVQILCSPPCMPTAGTIRYCCVLLVACCCCFDFVAIKVLVDVFKY